MKITLCGRKGCCPTIERQEDKRVIIKDDYDGEVVFTDEQWANLIIKIIDGEI